MVTSDGDPIFLKGVDDSRECKDKNYIAGQIEEIVPKIVVQIITNNAVRQLKVYWRGVSTFFFLIPCVVHTLNLAIKNYLWG